jgi:hypothetical protein
MEKLAALEKRLAKVESRSKCVCIEAALAPKEKIAKEQENLGNPASATGELKNDKVSTLEALIPQICS